VRESVPSPLELSPAWRHAVREHGKPSEDAPRPRELADRRRTDDPHPFAHSTELQALIARLQDERIRQGLSLADVAAASGQSRSAISRLENGHFPNPTLKTVRRYAAALGLRIALAIVPLAVDGGGSTPPGAADRRGSRATAGGRGDTAGGSG
jgi:DNA-binding XRE family transcriptional regulator